MSSLTSPKAQARRTKQQKEDDAIDREVILALMSTGRGRRHVYRRLFFAGIWHESAVLEPLQLAWRAGLRNEGLRLLSLIHEHCPEHYATMWQENNRAKQAEAEAEAQEAASPAEGEENGG